MEGWWLYALLHFDNTVSVNHFLLLNNCAMSGLVRTVDNCNSNSSGSCYQ